MFDYSYYLPLLATVLLMLENLNVCSVWLGTIRAVLNGLYLNLMSVNVLFTFSLAIWADLLSRYGVFMFLC
jgi:hypothetical protein